MSLWKVNLVMKKLDAVFLRTSMSEKVNFVGIRYHLWIVQFSVRSLTSTLQKVFCKITGSLGKKWQGSQEEAQEGLVTIRDDFISSY